MPEEPLTPLVFIPAAEPTTVLDGLSVTIVRTREEFLHWLAEPTPGAQWLQVEGLLADPEVWAAASQGSVPIPLDVIMADPATEFSSLYRLADVRLVREVRVTIPVALGFMKALRLAASLQLRVRLLPGQPSGALLAELEEAVQFYLHDPAVEAPIDFFHSLLAALREGASTTLWEIMEQDPGLYVNLDAERRPAVPMDFVETHLQALLASGAECAACRWQSLCAGYFKRPDPAYSCAGIKQVLARLDMAAEEISRDLAVCDAPLSQERLAS
jgi:hypothetical protein